MTDIFEKEDFERCKKQRKNVLTVFYIVTGIYALGAIGLFVYFLFLPYQAPEIG